MDMDIRQINLVNKQAYATPHVASNMQLDIVRHSESKVSVLVEVRAGQVHTDTGGSTG